MPEELQADELPPRLGDLFAAANRQVDALPSQRIEPDQTNFESVAPGLGSIFRAAQAQVAHMGRGVPEEHAPQMIAARTRASRMDETWTGRVLGGPIPLFSTGFRIGGNIQVGNAQRRISAGTPAEGDFDLIAQRERIEEIQRGETTGQSVGRELLHIPALVGEAALGARALGGIIGPATGAAARTSGGAAIASTGSLLATGATGAGRSVGSRFLGASAELVGRGVARNAITTAAVPAMWAPAWTERNIEWNQQHPDARDQRSPLDVRAIPAAYTMGMIQNAIFGSMSGPIGGITGTGVRARIGRFVARAATGMVEQEGIDVLTSAVSETLPHAYRLNAGYGSLGNLMHERSPEALRRAAVMAATMSAFALVHEVQHRDGFSPMEDAARMMRERHEQGVPPDQAGAEVAARLQADPQNADRIRAEIARLPEGSEERIGLEQHLAQFSDPEQQGAARQAEPQAAPPAIADPVVAPEAPAKPPAAPQAAPKPGTAAADIKASMEGLSKGFSEGQKAKIEEYAQRILAGQQANNVLQGIAPLMRAAVEARVAELRPPAQAAEPPKNARERVAALEREHFETLRSIRDNQNLVGRLKEQLAMGQDTRKAITAAQKALGAARTRLRELERAIDPERMAAAQEEAVARQAAQPQLAPEDRPGEQMPPQGRTPGIDPVIPEPVRPPAPAKPTAPDPLAGMGRKPTMLDRMRQKSGVKPLPGESLTFEQAMTDDYHMRNLEPNERQILKARLADPNRTLESIGQEMGYTRERIRQLEKSGLAKLGESLSVAKQTKTEAGRRIELKQEHLKQQEAIDELESNPSKSQKTMQDWRDLIEQRVDDIVTSAHADNLSPEQVAEAAWLYQQLQGDIADAIKHIIQLRRESRGDSPVPRPWAATNPAEATGNRPQDAQREGQTSVRPGPESTGPETTAEGTPASSTRSATEVAPGGRDAPASDIVKPVEPPSKPIMLIEQVRDLWERAKSSRTLTFEETAAFTKRLQSMSEAEVLALGKEFIGDAFKEKTKPGAIDRIMRRIEDRLTMASRAEHLDNPGLTKPTEPVPAGNELAQAHQEVVDATTESLQSGISREAAQEVIQSGQEAGLPEGIQAGIRAAQEQADASRGSEPAAGRTATGPTGGDALAGEPGRHRQPGAGVNPGIPGLGERGGWLDRVERAAWQRINNKLGRTNVLVDTSILADLAIVAGVKIARAGYAFAEFAKDMATRFGDEIKPHLKDIWTKAEAHADELSKPGPLAVKKASAGEERAKAGLPPTASPDPVGHSFPELRDQVQRIATTDPARVERIIADLQKGKIPTTDLDIALALYRMNQVRVAYAEATTRAREANRSGSVLDIAETRRLQAEARTALDEVTTATRQVGTVSGRALNAFKLMVNKDFSLSAMLARAETGKGRRLNPTEEAAVIDLHDQIRKLQEKSKLSEAALEKVTAALNAERAKPASPPVPAAAPKAEPGRAAEMPAASPAAPKPVERGVLDRVGAWFKSWLPGKPSEQVAAKEPAKRSKGWEFADRLEKQAIKELASVGKGNEYTFSFEATPIILGALAKYTAAKIIKGGYSFADFSKAIIGKFGDEVKPHVGDIWTKANEHVDLFKKPTPAEPADNPTLKIDPMAKNGAEILRSPEYKQHLLDRVAAQEAQDRFNKTVADDTTARGPIGRRISDAIVKSRVNFVISGVNTIGKIVSASLERIGISTLEQATGSFWSRVPGLSKIAAMAAREGRGLNLTTEASAIQSGLTEGIRDAMRIIRHGESSLDVLHGDKKINRGYLDYQFSIHGAAKEPAVRAEYTRSAIERLDHAIAAGEPISPAMIERVEALAYIDGQGAKFQNQNWLVDAYNRGVESLRSPKNNVAAQVTGLALKVAMPVVRIPTNIAFETATHVFGVGTGTIQALRAHYITGLQNLKPAEADAIMRQFKKGSLGAAAMILGALNPGMFGGYFTPRRDESDVRAGAVRIGGVDLPALTQHNPFLMTFQIGASFRRAFDRSAGMNTGERVGHSAWETVAGWFEELPMVRETGQVAGLTSHNARTRGYYLGEFLKSLAVPQLIQWIAGRTDVNPSTGNILTGDPNRRRPQTVGQHIGMGIPGVRQTVP